MKIYSSFNNNHYVGVVLVSDRGDPYMASGFRVQTEDQAVAHNIAINRALIFVSNNKPLYANNEVHTYISNSQKTSPEQIELFNQALAQNPYAEKWSRARNQQIHPFDGNLNEKDQYFLMCAGNEARFQMQRESFATNNTREL